VERPPPAGRSRLIRLARSPGRHLACPGCPIANRALRFNQSRLHHTIRASADPRLTRFVVPCLPDQATFPSGFRLQVGSAAQEYHAQLLPCCTGIKLRRDTAHSCCGPLDRRAQARVCRAPGRHTAFSGCPGPPERRTCSRRRCRGSRQHAPYLGGAPARPLLPRLDPPTYSVSDARPSRADPHPRAAGGSPRLQ
jgi:hypothetical protein